MKSNILNPYVGHTLSGWQIIAACAAGVVLAIGVMVAAAYLA